MTCHTAAQPAARPNSTTADHANVVRLFPAQSIMAPAIIAAPIAPVYEPGRRVALYGWRADVTLPAQVLTDLPGGRVLVRLTGSDRHVWAEQHAEPRLVSTREVI